MPSPFRSIRANRFSGLPLPRFGGGEKFCLADLAVAVGIVGEQPAFVSPDEILK